MGSRSVDRDIAGMRNGEERTRDFEQMELPLTSGIAFSRLRSRWRPGFATTPDYSTSYDLRSESVFNDGISSTSKLLYNNVLIPS